MVRFSLPVTDKFQEYCVRIVGYLPASMTFFTHYIPGTISLPLNCPLQFVIIMSNVSWGGGGRVTSVEYVWGCQHERMVLLTVIGLEDHRVFVRVQLIGRP